MDSQKLFQSKILQGEPCLQKYVDIQEYRNYTKRVPIGIDKYTNSEFKINFNNSQMITVIGETGTGKSIIESGLSDRFYLGGGRVVNVDIKGEYIYKFMPLQARDFDPKKYLLRGENPTGIDIISYYFEFLRRVTGYEIENEDYETYYSLPLNKISWIDFKNSLNTKSESIINTLDLFEAEGMSFDTYEEFEDAIDSMDGLGKIQKRMLKQKMKVLIKQGVFYEQKDIKIPSVVDSLINGKYVNINLRGVMRFGDFALAPSTNYLSNVLMEVYTAKQMGTIKRKDKVLILVDELPAFAPRNKMTSVKDALIKILRMGRSEGISLYVSGQDWKYIPEDFIKQSRYVFFSYKTQVDDLIMFIEQYFPSIIYEMSGGTRELKNEVISMLSDVSSPKKDGKRDWLVFDKQTREWTIVTPALPLSYIYGEGE